jgi:hypothetical protein
MCNLSCRHNWWLACHHLKGYATCCRMLRIIVAKFGQLQIVVTPFWVKCEDETHTPKSGNLESSKTPKNSELEFRGQKISHWGFLYTIGKVLKCRCSKWPRMSHLDICNISYGRKKGRESNWQFDSRPLKV